MSLNKITLPDNTTDEEAPLGKQTEYSKLVTTRRDHLDDAIEQVWVPKENVADWDPIFWQ